MEDEKSRAMENYLSRKRKGRRPIDIEMNASARPSEGMGAEIDHQRAFESPRCVQAPGPRRGSGAGMAAFAGRLRPVRERTAV